MTGITPIGWITIIGVVLMLLSLLLGQSRNKAIFNLANIMTLLGALGIGVLYWIFLT